MIDYVFDEERLLTEFRTYIDNTYREHYAKGTGKIQTYQLMLQSEDRRALNFAVMSIMKYADRFGNKNGYARKDLWKIAHFALLAIHALDNEREMKPKEKIYVKDTSSDLIIEDNSTQPYVKDWPDQMDY